MLHHLYLHFSCTNKQTKIYQHEEILLMHFLFADKVHVGYWLEPWLKQLFQNYDTPLPLHCVHNDQWFITKKSLTSWLDNDYNLSMLSVSKLLPIFVCVKIATFKNVKMVAILLHCTNVYTQENIHVDRLIFYSSIIDHITSFFANTDYTWCFAICTLVVWVITFIMYVLKY